jgi:glycosyltransferase involved in cell wall biosynthesis
MARRGVIFDLVAAQSPSYRGRGIARYSTDFVRAMVRYHPQLVHSIVVHPHLAPVQDLEDLSPWLTTRPDWQSASIIHLSSVFEPEVAVREFWPREASANRLLVAATVYDLIPDIWPDIFMEDPGLRRRWRCCREVARTADRVLTLSWSARDDTIRMLGVPAERVHFVGAAPSEHFRPPPDREAAWRTVSRSVRGLKPGYIIYVGAINPRKNVDGLIKAYAALPRHLIDRHQLLVQCYTRPLERNHYLVMAEQMGLRGRVLFPGYVADDVLVAEYQCAELNVFPSLYEGYGLPVMEALACGAPSIAGDNSSLVELMPPFARFDADDPAAISEVMAKALTDQVLRSRLLELTNQPPPTWEQVADRAAAVFQDMERQAEHHRPAWRSRPELALVGPPAGLARAVGELAGVECFSPPGPAHTRPAPGAMAYSLLPRLDPWRGGYDAIVCWVDGPARAKQALALAEDWPGRLVALVAEKGTGPAEASGLREGGARVVRSGQDWASTAQRLVAAIGDLAAVAPL